MSTRQVRDVPEDLRRLAQFEEWLDRIKTRDETGPATPAAEILRHERAR